MWWKKESQNNQPTDFTKQQTGVANIPTVNVNTNPVSIQPNPTNFSQILPKPKKQLFTKEVEATGYCPCAKCCGQSNRPTAMGNRPKEGRTVAVSPDIPLGTNIDINGKTYVAEDHGGAIKGDKIDIFFGKHQDALAFGRKSLTISYYA